MKAFSKRSSAVLDAPEDTYAQTSEWVGRDPAPAGALHRAHAGAYSPATVEQEPVETEETRYKPRLGSFKMRLRGGLPSSMAGKIALSLLGFGVVSAAAVGVFATRSYLLHDERFVIPASAEIQTVGNVHLTRPQLLSVFGEDVERNIFKVPLETRRADLERLPWVSHATVMRLLPDRIRVSVTERTPVAFVRQGTHIGLVDATGVLLDIPEDAAGDPHYSFPVLTGLSPDDPLSTRAARMEIYRRFVKELDGSGQKISDLLSEVDVSSPEDVKALIPSGGTDILVHFGDEDFLGRYRHFEEHLPEWKTQYPKLASADMRYDRQVVLEMQAGAGVPLDAAPASQPSAMPAVPANEAASATEKAFAKAPAKPAVKATLTPVKTAPAPVKAALTPVKTTPRSAARAESASNAKIFAALAAARQGKPKLGASQQ